MYGQFFTESVELQEKVFDLCRNRGSFLEPSAGKGHLVSFFEDQGIENIVALDLDSELVTHSNTYIVKMDFFDFPLDNKFDTIFGNPPYLRKRSLPSQVLSKIEKDSILKNCNLFYYFIEKSFKHLSFNGEMVFIVPHEFLTSSRAGLLRQLLYNNGTVTDIIDYGENRFFRESTSDIIIFRYEKDNHTHLTKYTLKGTTHDRLEIFKAGMLFYSDKDLSKAKVLGEFFDVKVGLATGANSVFEADTDLSIPVICSDYRATKKKRPFIFVEEFSLEDLAFKHKDVYNILIENKDYLLRRRIRSFTEEDWFKYGAVRNLSSMRQSGKCIYVNVRTRTKDPFFVDDIGYFEGSVLALYPKGDLDLNAWCDYLNKSKELFEEQGLFVGGRYFLTSSTLSNFLLVGCPLYE